jgi:GTP-binding protein YchF
VSATFIGINRRGIAGCDRAEAFLSNWEAISVRIGIVGFPFSGKTAVFTALSGLAPDQMHQANEQLAAVKVPDPRLAWLRDHYKPRKYTEATVDFVDFPGGHEGEAEHAGFSRHIPALRQCDVLLAVLREFENAAVPPHKNRIDPRADLAALRDELLIADLDICAKRVEKLEKAVVKPTKTQEQDRQELALMLRCRDAIEAEQPIRSVLKSPEEEKALRSFGFLTLKPMIVVLNVGEDAIGRPPSFSDPHAVATFALCGAVEADIIQLEPEERGEFMADYHIEALARDVVIRGALEALGMVSFFTVGEDEVRAWPLHKGGTAVEAAGRIHSDLARGFIRAEVVAYEDLHAAGDMREAKAAGKVRQEPKGYVVADGDVINIKFNV